MAVKPTSLRQLEEHFVCQYRCHGDEAIEHRLDVPPRVQRTDPKPRQRPTVRRR
jgi:hypothetical protein